MMLQRHDGRRFALQASPRAKKPVNAAGVLSGLAGLVLAPVGMAHTPDVPFPMVQSATGKNEVHLLQVVDQLDVLAELESVRMTNVPVPGADDLTVTLRRVEMRIGRNAIHVDGVPVGSELPHPMSIWSGRIKDAPDSVVYLAFSPWGSRGFYGTPGSYTHLLAAPSARGGWDAPTHCVVNDSYINSMGGQPDFTCNALTPPGYQPTASLGAQGGAPDGPGGPTPIYDAPIVFETDYEFFQLFGNMNAAQTYAMSLFGAVSDRYQCQVGVIFSYPYIGFHSTNTDPWTQTDCMSRLDQFVNAWSGGRGPAPAALYHLVSGFQVSGCGGVAYLDVLCNSNLGFGMSAHINRRGTFPPVQGPLTWDYFVISHELGHNFSAPHTHDYNPPIDNCASGDCSVAPNGTIMSYCHTCPGGMSNINLTFHRRVETTIRNRVVNSCLQTNHASISVNGSSCGRASTAFYEQFQRNHPIDLSGLSMRLAWTGDSYIAHADGAFVAPTAAAQALPLGDDSEVAVPLSGGSFPYIGGTTSTLYVCSNGFVSAGNGNTLSERVGAGAWLDTIQPRWGTWHNFDPSASGSGPVLFEERASIAYITWDGVLSRGRSVLHTWQLQFDLLSGDVTYAWVQVSQVPGGGQNRTERWVVGYAGYAPNSNVGDVDISARLPTTFRTWPCNASDLRLSGSLPRLGSTLTLTTSGFPCSSTHGLQFLSRALLSPRWPLEGLGMPNCFLYVRPDLGTSMYARQGQANTRTRIPVDPAFAGVVLYAQSVAYTPSVNVGGFVTSNYVSLTLGY